MRGEILGQFDEVLSLVEDYFECRINNWQDMLPLYVQQHLSNLNLGGDFLILLNFVFRPPLPTLAPQSGRSTLLQLSSDRSLLLLQYPM
jgi:hypothetical protein